MEDWKQYILSVIICSLSCGFISQIISDPKRKELLRLIFGSILGIALLNPLSRMNLEVLLLDSLPSTQSAELYIREGEKKADEIRAEYIKASCEAYILDKAQKMGTEVETQIILNNDLIPIIAEITGAPDSSEQIQLQQILATDLGIPKENQQWIWLQENNSS